MFAMSLQRLVCLLPIPLSPSDKTQNVPAELTALINDTTGTLIASNYVDPNTKIAVIFGTGCNAAYMETAGSIPKMANLQLPEEQGMAINVSDVRSVGISRLTEQCEWGAFDSFEHQHLPRTKYDIIIDESSNKPGEQVSLLTRFAPDGADSK